MADLLNWFRDSRTARWIAQNYHDTLGDGSKYAADVNVVDGLLGATGTAFMSKAVLTRPSATTQYDALDGVTDSLSAPSAIEFANVNRATGLGAWIVTSRLYKSTTSVTTATFRLWLYSDVPASVPLDNAAWASRLANADIGLGYIDYTNYVLGADCVVYEGELSSDFAAPVIPAVRSIYGILQTQTGSTYTPGASEKFRMYLRGVWV
jgi:hypothetical protein